MIASHSVGCLEPPVCEPDKDSRCPGELTHWNPLNVPDNQNTRMRAVRMAVLSCWLPATS